MSSLITVTSAGLMPAPTNVGTAAARHAATSTVAVEPLAMGSAAAPTAAASSPPSSIRVGDVPRANTRGATTAPAAASRVAATAGMPNSATGRPASSSRNTARWAAIPPLATPPTSRYPTTAASRPCRLSTRTPSRNSARIPGRSVRCTSLRSADFSRSRQQVLNRYVSTSPTNIVAVPTAVTSEPPSEAPAERDSIVVDCSLPRACLRSATSMVLR